MTPLSAVEQIGPVLKASGSKARGHRETKMFGDCRKPQRLRRGQHMSWPLLSVTNDSPNIYPSPAFSMIDVLPISHILLWMMPSFRFCLMQRCKIHRSPLLHALGKMAAHCLGCGEQPVRSHRLICFAQLVSRA